MDTGLRTLNRSRRHYGAPPRQTLAVALVLCAIAFAQVALAAPRVRHDCARVEATVIAPTLNEAREACHAAAAAAHFLAGQGMPPIAPIDLHLVDELPLAEATATRGGVYLHSERRAYVLRRVRWQAMATPFGLPMTQSLYRSILVHEVAHAIVAAHFRIAEPDVVAHEYLAYVAQIASMPAALRERVVAALSAGRRPADARFNLFILGMNPDRFAVLAWRHWNEPENGAAFLHAVLAGQALAGG